MNRRSFIQLIVAIPASLVALRATAKESWPSYESGYQVVTNQSKYLDDWPYEGAAWIDNDTGLVSYYIDGRWHGWGKFTGEFTI